MELLLSKKVGIFKTFLIVFFGEEFSRLDEKDFGNFYQPNFFYNFVMVKILKKLFLINEELNQKSLLIQEIVHRVFGSRSGNFEVMRGRVQPHEADIENKKSTRYFFATM